MTEPKAGAPPAVPIEWIEAVTVFRTRGHDGLADALAFHLLSIQAQLAQQAQVDPHRRSEAAGKSVCGGRIDNVETAMRRL